MRGYVYSPNTRLKKIVWSVQFAAIMSFVLWAAIHNFLGKHIWVYWAVVILIVLSLIWHRIKKTNNSLQKILNRQFLNDNEIYNIYSSRNFNKISVIDAWHELSQALHVPSGCLRHTDVLGKDVDVLFFPNEHTDVIDVKIISKRIKKTPWKDVNVRSIKTVDDYIVMMASL